VHAAVDHQTDTPEDAVVQLADMAERVVLHRRPFRPPAARHRAPSLRHSPKELDLAQRGQARFLRQRELEVMARHALVIGQRGQGPARHFGGVAQVDVIGAGARAVERAVLVIAARRAGLGGLGHAADVELGLGQGAEIFGQARLHRHDLLVEVGDELVLAFVGVGIAELGIVVERAQALADGALGVALGLEDFIGLRALLGDQFEPDAVDFLGSMSLVV
jgi:hypothetical protein